MCGNQKSMRKGQVLLTVRLLNNSDMLSLHVLPHLLCFIETKKLVGIVDEHVEMPEEAPTQKPTNLWVKRLNLCQALDNNQGPSDGEWASFDEIWDNQLSFGVAANSGDVDVSLRLEFEFRRQRRLNDRNLRARVHEEFVWPRSVDRYRNTYL